MTVVVERPPGDVDALPVPIDDLLTRPYWAAAREHVLRLPRCSSCGRFIEPWLPVCPSCVSSERTWENVSGTGTVWTFCVTWGDFVPGFETPYVVAEIALDDVPDFRLVANVLQIDPADVTIDMPVEVAFEPRGGGWVIPQFIPVSLPSFGPSSEVPRSEAHAAARLRPL